MGEYRDSHAPSPKARAKPPDFNRGLLLWWRYFLSISDWNLFAVVTAVALGSCFVLGMGIVDIGIRVVCRDDPFALSPMGGRGSNIFD